MKKSENIKAVISESGECVSVYPSADESISRWEVRRIEILQSTLWILVGKSISKDGYDLSFGFETKADAEDAARRVSACRGFPAIS